MVEKEEQVLSMVFLLRLGQSEANGGLVAIGHPCIMITKDKAPIILLTQQSCCFTFEIYPGLPHASVY